MSQHRTIRRYKNEEIDWQTLEHAALAASTSEYLQSYTIIRVTSSDIRHQIARISGSQVLQQENGELFIFVVDSARNIRWAQQEDPNIDISRFTDWNAFLAGVFDATIGAQSMLSYGEEHGLGGCYLGSILNDPQEMINLLNLPSYTFPILGLMMGIPDDDPDVKPRLPYEFTCGENSYPALSADLWDEKHESYNDQLIHYYSSRSETFKHTSISNGARDFTDLLMKHSSAPTKHRLEIGTILQKQGFSLPQ